WQEKMRARVRLAPLGRVPRLVAGVDAAYDRAERIIYGAAVLYSYPDLEFLEEAGAKEACSFPYIPGLLSFREAPVLAAALARLNRTPEVVLVDGQGIAHPRGLGLASHLGLLLDLPTIGVAKSRLVGEGREPDYPAGSASPLYWEGETVGWIVRTRDGVRPLYISPGHRLTLAECRDLTLGCVRRYRLPLPLRQADILSRRLRRAGGLSGASPRIPAIESR
ncbi:MAG: endonuclease V, partial [Deltaproteobacteria bacterium]|nr:endonuclease V [Deltaproteobacteria bacterium]